MSGDLVVGGATSTDRTARYDRSEAALWTRYGLQPIERFVTIPEPRIRLRTLEIGTGRPILLVHGTVGPAAWAPLVAEMRAEGRFIVLDRPGWGGSEAIDFRRHPDYHAVAADILSGVLDGLGIDRAAVVGGSIGDVWALSLPERYPSRIERVALLGGGPLIAQLRPPTFIRMLASPLGALIVRLPMTASRTRSIVADSGHAASLAAGRIPDAFIDYRISVSNDTPAMRHERAMVAHLVHRNEWRGDLPFDEPALARIAAPTLMVVGTNDNIGDPDTWRTFVTAIPGGQFELIDGAGHMLWFDEPAVVAGHLRRFLGDGAAG
jgi:pimeloyl-ACP methyl ester carboxylesterase